MASVLIAALRFIALHGPVAWASNWYDRAWRAELEHVMCDRPIVLSDVLPWPPRRTISAAGIDCLATPQPCDSDRHGSQDQPAQADSPSDPSPDRDPTERPPQSTATPLRHGGLKP